LSLFLILESWVLNLDLDYSWFLKLETWFMNLEIKFLLILELFLTQSWFNHEACFYKFYANAWSTEEGVMDKRSRVRGQWIPYDIDAINQFLGHPLILEEGQQCEYAEWISQFSGFDEETIDQLLCSPEHDFAWSVVGKWVRIMRTSITTLTQIWMTFLLSNILPSDHNSNLTLPKCQLVYNIMRQISVHVAQLISYVIHQFVGIAPLRYPVDPEKSNRALGFPALIKVFSNSTMY